VRAIDCLILSTGRSASTSIYHYIDQRAKLALPWNKEPHTLIRLQRYPNRSQLADEIHVSDINAFEALYANSKLMIDASVGYFFYIQDLIATLRDLKQVPKVVFLYREPVSRAASLFNELRKKRFEESPSLVDALSRQKPENLWWENYYDNVPYFDNYCLMQSYFKDILSISYSDISTQPLVVVDRILAFLGTQAIADLDYSRYNSSAEATALAWGQRLPHLKKLLPPAAKRALINLYSRLHVPRSYANQNIEKYLSYSMQQYRLFKAHISPSDGHDRLP